TVFEDHTAPFDAVQRLAGCPVSDTTSFAFPEAIHRVLQVPVDVTQGTTEKAAVDQLRGILLARPMALRVGVICHKKHRGSIEQIESPFRDRIELVDHFWSGNGRASNRWLQQCDLLVVLGTPRIGESAIQEALIRQGMVDAAKHDGHFTEAVAVGETESGRLRTFLTLSYQDSDWNAAYRQLVAAELVQSVGRSRYIRPKGIPETIVVSIEPLDLPLADEEFSRITDKEAELYQTIVSAADKQKPRLSQTSHRGGGVPTGTIQRGRARKVPTIYYRDFRAPVSPKPYLPEKGFGYKCLAKITGESPSTVRGRLKRLCDSGLISKCSHSGYWPIVFPG
ncbi:MAG: hypothetical protein IID46_09635, partial [Planctomycetes bacterium]|nr:hypothetical protein [Planctomycetota bacterium]